MRKREAPATGATDTLSPNHPDPPTSLMNQEQKNLVSQSLELLPARYRLFIQLYFDQSLSPEEIANILRVSINAVYTQKSRILGKLRETLRDSGVL
ncbi:MAG: sigma-70 family RNA polymerase sigma factor [Deltaproteobacteria bacterium]|nr:sigma-70 family RNA polymerase sigma factor [Deltaproteobacteria bacterium]